MTQSTPYMSTAAPPSEAELKAIAQILHAESGIVIGHGKGSMVQSRLAKRLRALGLSQYQAYIDLVQSEGGAQERWQMISALTTNVTHFFRESHHFETLRKEALPELLTRARAGGRVRIWSAGASNGQEAYSIAMTLAEAAPDLDKLDIRILATDIDPVMVQRGAEGIYDSATLEAVPEALRKTYFSPEDGCFRIVERLRKLVTFRELNLHHPWPMKGLFDVIFCRNVVIYFDPAAEEILWQRFEAALAPRGWIHVGHSERIPLERGRRLVTAGITTYRLPDEAPKTGENAWH